MSKRCRWRFPSRSRPTSARSRWASALRLEDIPQLEGVVFLDDPHETVIATVSAPIVEVEPEPEEGEELAEGEEAPEGAAEGETPEGETAAAPDSESTDSEG